MTAGGAEDLTSGLTISQVAAFAGVTVKTVRHYHRFGLVDEPARDASGYRCYVSADLLRLLQVRTLAAAGVPLIALKDKGVPVPEIAKKLTIKTGKNAGKSPRSPRCTGPSPKPGTGRTTTACRSGPSPPASGGPAIG